MSGSDDTSDFNSQSPFSQINSPYSSPSQQVPQLANFLTELTCIDNSKREGPYLHILEEPMNHFRFRYKSEMIGTHGCLLGISHATRKTKTHPTVELRNYSGKARIRCTLARHDCVADHPHKLQDDQDRDMSSIVPEKNSYKVAFSGMGIIHTAKKDVSSMLFQKYIRENPSLANNEDKLRVKCENEARIINLNIVRLKFSAHDLRTSEEICPAIFSQPIHNLKSAATNDLKICRMSRVNGGACGGDDVFLLVEKVKKNNIMIRFFELDESGKEVWTATGKFLQTDVHHQYAIVFRTPPYDNPKTSSDVSVFIELVRPSDGRTSEPQQFTYKAHPIYRQNKKRKPNSSYSSLDSETGSLKSLSGFPTVISQIENNHFTNQDVDMKCDEERVPNVIKLPIPTESLSPTDNLMGDAMLYDLHSDPLMSTMSQLSFSPVLSQPNISAIPESKLTSSERTLMNEFDTLLRNISVEDMRQLQEGDLSEYFRTFPSGLDGTQFTSSSFVADSGRQQKSSSNNTKTTLELRDEKKINIKKEKETEYAAYYKPEDGEEVKKLVKEICEMIRTKTNCKKQIVKAKLERLFEIRLSNGDTFLHMTLCSNQPSLEYIVKLIHSVKMTSLLNLKNHRMQTILHLAIIYDLPKLVAFLVSKGCDPMIEGEEKNNALHYAVICQSCLGPLLDAIKFNNVHCDLNTYNNEKQSPLHLAVLYKSEESAFMLTRAGATLSTRDHLSRTPLHIAVLNNCLPIVRVLLAVSQPEDIDAVDNRGYTALQMVCDGQSVEDDTVNIVKLLLDYKADPMKCTDDSEPAWKLAQGKEEILLMIKEHVDIPEMMAEDIKSEPEDEYESADENDMYDTGALAELSLYLKEIAPLLDTSGAWRELAKRVQRDSLLSWYGGTHSPSTTLLNHIKIYNDNFTSKSLALILEDMGEVEASRIIRNCISD